MTPPIYWKHQNISVAASFGPVDYSAGAALLLLVREVFVSHHISWPIEVSG